jgi:iron(III) transport system ATP-binding protein
MGEAMVFPGVAEADGSVTLGPLRLKPRHAVAPGTVKVAVRPEAWEIGAADGLPAILRKAAYLGSFYEYGFDTTLGPVFVVSTDLSQPLAAGAQTTLSLRAHGVSVVPGA